MYSNNSITVGFDSAKRFGHLDGFVTIINGEQEIDDLGVEDPDNVTDVNRQLVGLRYAFKLSEHIDSGIRLSVLFESGLSRPRWGT